MDGLSNIFINKQDEIESWLQSQLAPPAFVATSVDLRNAGFKIAAIDANLFPAGFNNLHPDTYPRCITAAKQSIQALYPYCQHILIIAENHTRNPHYYQSLATFANFLEEAGYHTKVGSWLIENPQPLLLSNGTLTLYPLKKKENKIVSGDFIPCLILLNNDLSEGIPSCLQDIKQPIEPPTKLGWALRRKSTHFAYYQTICQKFADFIQIDPWLISAFFLSCQGIDFMQREGFSCLIDQTEQLFTDIQKKYQKYEIYP